MPRTTYLIFTMALVSVTCINGLKSSAGPFEMTAVKSSSVQSKEDSKSLLGSDTDYALNALAIPYIKDKRLRKMVATFYWCGTPTQNYVMNNGMPPEQLLKDRAARIEARWLNDD